MKLSTILVASTIVTSDAFAFAPIIRGRPPAVSTTSTQTTSTTSLAATSSSSSSRREVLLHQASTLGAVAIVLLSGTPANAEPRPMYLTEPTEEFKANEAKAMQFKRDQLDIKNKFLNVLNRISTTSRSEKDLVRDLNELQDLVIATGGLPLGIKKEDMYKTIRRVKAMGNWPTNVEIAVSLNAVYRIYLGISNSFCWWIFVASYVGDFEFVFVWSM
jgi:hypothetical protein